MGRRTVVTALLGAAAACGTGDVPGSISGDVFLVMANGEVRRGAGQWLYLLPADAGRAREASCARYHAAVRERDEQLVAWTRAKTAIAERRSALLAREADSVHTLILEARQDRAWSGVQAEQRILRDWQRREKVLRDSLRRAMPSPTAPAVPENYELEAELMVSIFSALVRSRVDSAKANIDARFVFTAVPPGAYDVLATTVIGDQRYTWFAPVTVRAGQAVVRDLDNEVEVGDVLFSCTP